MIKMHLGTEMREHFMRTLSYNTKIDTYIYIIGIYVYLKTMLNTATDNNHSMYEMKQNKTETSNLPTDIIKTYDLVNLRSVNDLCFLDSVVCRTMNALTKWCYLLNL